MIKCDPRAKAKCPFKDPCCGEEDGYFVEGSECDKFNQEVLAPPPTNADHIRAMSDEELAVFIYTATRACNNYECESCPIGDENCPDLDKWLKQPAERGVENGETEQTENRP